MATLEEFYQSSLRFNNNGVVQMGLGDYSSAGKYFCQALSFLKHFVKHQHTDGSNQLGYDDPHVMTLRGKRDEFGSNHASNHPIRIEIKQPFVHQTRGMSFCPVQRQFTPDPSSFILNDPCQNSDWVQPITLNIPDNTNKAWIESHTSDIETVVVLLNIALNYAAIMKTNPATVPNVIGTKLRMLELAQELITEIMTFMAEDNIPSYDLIGLYHLEAIVTSSLLRAQHNRGMHNVDPTRFDSSQHLLRRLEQVDVIVNQYHTQVRNKNSNILNNFFQSSSPNNSCTE
jgi:hypothetical protein